MDSLTQAALGATVGHLCWNKKIGNKALLLGALGGTLPDLDILFYPFLNDIQRLYWHRGESHSIWFVLFGSVLTGWLASRYFKGGKLPFPSAVQGALLIYATHILIDYFTVYGTQLLAPLSRTAFVLAISSSSIRCLPSPSFWDALQQQSQSLPLAEEQTWQV